MAFIFCALQSSFNADRVAKSGKTPLCVVIPWRPSLRSKTGYRRSGALLADCANRLLVGTTA